MNNREYVLFLLGADNFDVCKRIRKLCEEQGTDVIFDKVCAITDTIIMYEYNKGFDNNVDYYTNVSRLVEELFTDDIFKYLQDEITENEYLKRAAIMFVGDEYDD